MRFLEAIREALFEEIENLLPESWRDQIKTFPIAAVVLGFGVGIWLGMKKGDEVSAAGTSMANHLAMATLIDPGDEVLFPDPGFPNTKTFSLRSRKPPSSSVRICRIAFVGNRLRSKFCSDFSSGSAESFNNRCTLVFRRCSHSREITSSKYCS